jgi:hypothetical protein
MLPCTLVFTQKHFIPGYSEFHCTIRRLGLWSFIFVVSSHEQAAAAIHGFPQRGPRAATDRTDMDRPHRYTGRPLDAGRPQTRYVLCVRDGAAPSLEASAGRSPPSMFPSTAPAPCQPWGVAITNGGGAPRFRPPPSPTIGGK